MRLLCNENIPLHSIHLLREHDHEVYSIMESCPGISDEEVMKLARDSNFIILTFDRDYGELIFRNRLPVPPGVIYLRLFPHYPDETAELVLQLFDRSDIELQSFFTVVDRENIRQRKLP